mgnify:CR=1 FL=1
MIVFPAIDLKAGQVVRLAEGDMARATVYGDDPARQARAFADAGASWLHVVDLDGARAAPAYFRAPALLWRISPPRFTPMCSIRPPRNR